MTKKESETAEIHKTRCLKMQSENLNDIQPQEQSENHHDARKGENINTKEEWNGDKIVGKEECLHTLEFSEIRIPKMMKHGRPKGVEVQS